MTILRMILTAVFLFLVANIGVAKQAQESKQEDKFKIKHLSILHQALKIQDGKLYRVDSVPKKGAKPETKQMTYQVSIPYQEDGETKMRVEQRTRMVTTIPNVNKPVQLGENVVFKSPDGTEIKREEVLKRFQGKPKRVIVWNSPQPLPEEWKQFLHPDAIVMTNANIASK